MSEARVREGDPLAAVLALVDRWRERQEPMPIGPEAVARAVNEAARLDGSVRWACCEHCSHGAIPRGWPGHTVRCRRCEATEQDLLGTAMQMVRSRADGHKARATEAGREWDAQRREHLAEGLEQALQILEGLR